MQGVRGILRALLHDRAAAPYQPTPAAFSERARTLRSEAQAGCPATTDLVTMRLAEPPEPCEWLRSA
jgi:hypothetical protein